MGRQNEGVRGWSSTEGGGSLLHHLLLPRRWVQVWVLCQAQRSPSQKKRVRPL